MADKFDFTARVLEAMPDAASARCIDTLVLNVGLRCDLACAHCHHECSPTREESMGPDVADAALHLAELVQPAALELTGGAPELWPPLREFIERAARVVPVVRMRTNLTAMRYDPSLPDFLAEHRVELIASLPSLLPDEVAEQRGARTLERSLSQLAELARVGYGRADGPPIDIAVNPRIGRLPGGREEMLARFAEALGLLGVDVRQVLPLPNVPIGRCDARLDRDGRADSYRHKLADAFDHASLSCLSCRTTLTIGWDGRLADCDFNLAAGAGLSDEFPATVFEALERAEELAERQITFGPHCFACTAGGGAG